MPTRIPSMDPEFVEKWNRRYREAEAPSAPAGVLTENLHLLPRHGEALDLACGLGGNGLLLARQGLSVTAWDISPVAIEHVRRAADAQGLTLRAEVRDVQLNPPPARSFDVIVVAHFLERELAPILARALAPGGLLFYESFTRTRVDDTGPRSESFRLADNELLRLFGSLRILVYREEGRVGNPGRGYRNKAILVAQRLDPEPGSVSPV